MSNSSASASAAAAASAPSSSSSAPMLTDEERQIYDRQLRVWGVDAQKRMRDSHVLLIGMSGLNCEVGKNLALAGIGHLTLLDDSLVRAEDLSANFLLSHDSIGLNRAQASVAHLCALNPNVHITALTSSLSSMLSQESFFHQFRAICAVGQPITLQMKLNQLLRKQTANTASASSSSSSTPSSTASSSPSSSIPTAFFSGEVFGLYAYFFEDLQKHSYTQTKTRKDTSGNEEEYIEAGEKIYRRSLSDLYNASGSSSSLKYPEMQKAFGRKKQEKLACDLWTCIQIVQKWRGDKNNYPNMDTKEEEAEAVASLTSVRTSVLSSLVDAPDSGVVAPIEQIRVIASNAQQDVSHICAVVGGILGQEILKVVSGKDEPLSNLFVFSAQEGFGIIKEI